MSQTNFAYAIMGVRISISELFVAGESCMGCRHHGVAEGQFCSVCGDRLFEKWEQLPTSAMQEAADFYKKDPLELFHEMREKYDTDNDAPLGIWGTDYGKNQVDLNNEDEVIIGLKIVETPFKGHEEYPMADRSMGFVIEIDQLARGHLRNFAIAEKPRLFVFSYA